MAVDKRIGIICPACGVTNDKPTSHCGTCASNLDANYFEVLGVQTDASIETIHTAYLRAAAKYHPDKTAKHSEALRTLADHRMRQLNHIWGILKNPAQREKYLNKIRLQTHFAQHGFANDPVNNPANDVADHEAVDPLEEASEVPIGIALLRRFIARSTDYALFGFVLYMLDRLFGAPVQSEIKLIINLSAGSGVQLLILGMGLFSLFTLFWACVETILLAFFATTAGKWLMRIRIVNKQAEPLDLGSALARSWSVWLRGMAGGMVVITPLLWLLWYSKLRQGENLPWDGSATGQPLYEDLSAFTYATALIILLPAVALIVLDWQPRGLDFLNTFFFNNLQSITAQVNAPPLGKPIAIPAPVSVIPGKVIESGLLKKPEQPEQTAIAVEEPKIAVTAVPNSSETQATASSASNPKPEPAKPELTKTGPVLPPPLRPGYQAPSVMADTGRSNVTASTAPARIAKSVSDEQRTSCMTRYFEMMHEAATLPLGDYVRLDRSARSELERCLQ